ncbi:hypothetical protein [Polyangium sp. 6x1]|uniref:hypothetical protein n=1 Tax=Polyangium sp. 6x1 TaxID=3042689 RepID=UPI002482EC48|nr:hypothetical protein [Polyangium sp. 6x1]MDI1444359.1 hypothetical protein [Polyangium sp. 6x1]
MIVDRGDVAYGVNRDEVDPFARLVRLPERLIVAMANGHYGGTEDRQISCPVLDSIERALLLDPTTSLESLFDTARSAFLIAAEPYPDDDDYSLIGGPHAELTVVELSPGRLRAGGFGRYVPILVRDGAVHGEIVRSPSLERKPAAPFLVEHPLLDGDCVLVCDYLIGYYVSGKLGPEIHRELVTVIEDLARAHQEPGRLVEAALLQWQEGERQTRERKRRGAIPLLPLAVARARTAAPAETPHAPPTAPPVAAPPRAPGNRAMRFLACGEVWDGGQSVFNVIASLDGEDRLVLTFEGKLVALHPRSYLHRFIERFPRVLLQQPLVSVSMDFTKMGFIGDQGMYVLMEIIDPVYDLLPCPVTVRRIANDEWQCEVLRILLNLSEQDNVARTTFEDVEASCGR